MVVFGRQHLWWRLRGWCVVSSVASCQSVLVFCFASLFPVWRSARRCILLPIVCPFRWNWWRSSSSSVGVSHVHFLLLLASHLPLSRFGSRPPRYVSGMVCFRRIYPFPRLLLIRLWLLIFLGSEFRRLFFLVRFMQFLVSGFWALFLDSAVYYCRLLRLFIHGGNFLLLLASSVGGFLVGAVCLSVPLFLLRCVALSGGLRWSPGHSFLRLSALVRGFAAGLVSCMGCGSLGCAALVMVPSGQVLVLLFLFGPPYCNSVRNLAASLSLSTSCSAECFYPLMRFCLLPLLWIATRTSHPPPLTSRRENCLPICHFQFLHCIGSPLAFPADSFGRLGRPRI